MKKIIVVLVIMIALLVGCDSDIPEEVNTLTCEYDGSITVYTYTEDEFISEVTDGEESDVDFWLDVIEESYNGSIIAFLEDMEKWYTSPFFEKSSCIYE